jgi:hypothetical protein
MDFVVERSAQKAFQKDTAGLANDRITEGQQLDVPWAHPELCSRAGTFASLEIKRNCSENRSTGEDVATSLLGRRRL